MSSSGKGDGRTDRARPKMIRRGAAAGIAAAMAVGALPFAASLSFAADSEPLVVREVQEVRTGEFGVDRPVGVAYDRAGAEFLVVGEAEGDDVDVLRLGAYGDGLGIVEVDGVEHPSAVTFDDSGGALVVLDDDGVVEVPAAELAEGGEAEAGDPLPVQLDVEEPVSAAIGDDVLYVLDGQSGDITVAELDDPDAEPTSVDLPDDDAVAIAVHPSDGLLYVLSDGYLDALDATGAVVASYDTTSVPWASPRAMAFAPSTDRTDDPSVQNLFVAEAGDELGGGVVEVTLEQPLVPMAAITQSGTLVRSTATSGWVPPSTDPSGVTWVPGNDRLVVVDSEIEEISLFAGVNMWHTSRLGAVQATGTTFGSGSAGSYSSEPTGAGYDPISNTLFVSDDSADGVFVVKPGADGVFGNSNDVVTKINTGSIASDTEDPEFDPLTGHLFFLSGTDREIFRVNSVDGVFGNSNDVITSFDISHLGPTDYEGLAKSPTRASLYVGARSTGEIFEVDYTGALLRTIDLNSISSLGFISGLALAPSTSGSSPSSLYIVDRGVDEANDGRLFEISAPDLGGVGVNLPPQVNAGFDQSVPYPTPVSLTGSVADDGLPTTGSLTQTWSKVTGPGNVSFAAPNAVSTTATFSAPGTYRLRLTASDGELSTFAEVTVVTLAPNQPPVLQPISDVSITEGDAVQVPVVVSDPDGDPVTVTHDGLPSFGSYDEVTRTFTLSPPLGAAGSYGPVTVSATDPASLGAAPTHVASASSVIGTTGSAITVNRPTGTQSGDLLLAQIRFRGSSAAQLTAPDGWTLVGALTDNNANHAVYRRVATGAEPAAYTFNQTDTGGKMAAAIAAYRGVDVTNPIDAWAASAINTPTLGAPSATATVGNTTVVRLWGFRSIDAGTTGLSGNQPPAGVTPRWETLLDTGSTGTDRNRVLGGDQVQVVAGPTGTATASGAVDTSENRRSAFTVVLRPALVPSPPVTTTFNITVTPVPPTTGTLSGTITTGGLPVAGVWVMGYSPSDGWVGSVGAITAADGTYTISNVPPGEYRIAAVPLFTPGLTARWYADSPSRTTATPVTVTAGSIGTGLDVALVPTGGSITGTVTGPGGVPAAGVTVWAYLPTDAWVGSSGAVTGPDGSYVLPNLPPGEYRLQFVPPTGSGLVRQWYLGTTVRGLATPFTVTQGSSFPGVNVSLLGA